MTTTAGVPLDQMVGAASSALLIATSKDVDAKITALLFDDAGRLPRAVVKVPTTDAAAVAVATERALLEGLARLDLGNLGATVPRLVDVADAVENCLAVTALPGTPMLTRYHRWPHTASRRAVGLDFAAAANWLATLQQATGQEAAPVSLAETAAVALQARFPDHPQLTRATAALQRAHATLGNARTPRTVVHGDYWLGNVLVDSMGHVSGVVDWEQGELEGEPLRDVARFALTYSLYLDRHTRPGRRVLGHRGLRTGTWGAGISYGIDGKGWYPTLVSSFLGAGLARLGASPSEWRALAIAGIGDVAATAVDDDFAGRHVALLARIGAG